MNRHVFEVHKEYQAGSKLVCFKRPAKVVEVASCILNECGTFPKLKKLLALLEQHDAITFVHSSAVAVLSLRIGMEFGYNSQMSSWLLLSALMHDIGKVMLPRELLNKVASLTQQEMTLLKLHAQWGIELLKLANIPEGVMQGILQHHERWDGTGYPLQLSKHEIHPFAQIIAVADVFDALTTAKAYRPATSAQIAVEILKNESGTSFSPGIVSAFLSVMEKKVHKA